MYVLSRNKHTISPYLIRRGFSKVPKTFRARKPFVKLQPANSVKLGFSYVVKGIKSKITAKFLASRRLHFEYTKRIMSTEMRPKSFGTFEKQGPRTRTTSSTRFSHRTTLSARKPIGSLSKHDGDGSENVI